MISSITGTVISVRDNNIVLENSGIGFLINMPAISANTLIQGDRDVTVYTHMAVKEDDISLYGFLTFDELDIFKQLITVSGIGPKGALSILSDISADKLKYAIVKGDAKLISSAQGIGLKSAQKICIELKDKYKNEVDLSGEDEKDTHTLDSSLPEIKDAIDVLSALGFSKTSALIALNEIKDASELDTSALVSAALKKIR